MVCSLKNDKDDVMCISKNLNKIENNWIFQVINMAAFLNSINWELLNNFENYKTSNILFFFFLSNLLNELLNHANSFF